MRMRRRSRAGMRVAVAGTRRVVLARIRESKWVASMGHPDTGQRSDVARRLDGSVIDDQMRNSREGHDDREEVCAESGSWAARDCTHVPIGSQTPGTKRPAVDRHRGSLTAGHAPSLGGIHCFSHFITLQSSHSVLTRVSRGQRRGHPRTKPIHWILFRPHPHCA